MYRTHLEFARLELMVDDVADETDPVWRARYAFEALEHVRLNVMPTLAEERRACLVELRNQGLTLAEIGAELDPPITESRVSRILSGKE